MSIVLDLPEEVELRLAAEAEARKLTLSEYVLQLVSRSSVPASSIHTGAELVAYWQKEGLIGTRPDIADSQQHARAIRERAQRRVQE